MRKFLCAVHVLINAMVQFIFQIFLPMLIFGQALIWNIASKLKWVTQVILFYHPRCAATPSPHWHAEGLKMLISSVKETASLKEPVPWSRPPDCLGSFKYIIQSLLWRPTHTWSGVLPKRFLIQPQSKLNYFSIKGKLCRRETIVLNNKDWLEATRKFITLCRIMLNYVLFRKNERKYRK